MVVNEEKEGKQSREEARTTGQANVQGAEVERRSSVSKLKTKLKFHHLPKPPPRASTNDTLESFKRSYSMASSIASGNTRSSMTRRSGGTSRKNKGSGGDNDERDGDGGDNNNVDATDAQSSSSSDSTMEPIFNKIPHFPLSQSELEYIALTPVELVVQNLRESMMYDVPIHQLEIEPENWANVGWYLMSSSAPIVAASIGPLANLCSTASVADTWRSSFSTPVTFPADLPWVYGLNGVSLFVGCISNLSLYMNFTGLINHRLSQIISIGGWYLASFILIALISAAQFVYFSDGVYQRYAGYWYGVVAAVLYFVGATLLLINEIGRRLKKSKVSLSITRMQSRLMLLNVIFFVWIGMGGGIYTAMIQGLTYGDAVYFCMGVCLTVAAGDILPKTHLARSITIPYAYIGVFLVGLSVASISAAIVDSNGTALVYRKIEQSRKKLYQQLVDEDKFSQMKPEEAFQMLRKIHKTETRSADNQLAFKALLLYAAFLFLGAMAFSLIEGWTYFQAIYFCGLVFVANSFGDFTPKTPGGRTFFVVWAVGGVPMMTILISSLASTIFHFLAQEGDNITSRLVKLTGLIGKIGIFHNDEPRLKVAKRIHNLIIEAENQDTTSNSKTQPAPTVRPGQPLFLRTASTITKDDSDESLFRDWSVNVESDTDEEAADENNEGGVDENNEGVDEDNEEIGEDNEEGIENENNYVDEKEGRVRSRENNSEETDDAFNDEDEDDQPDNIAIEKNELDQEEDDDDDNINYADSEVLVHNKPSNVTNEIGYFTEDNTSDIYSKPSSSRREQSSPSPSSATTKALPSQPSQVMPIPTPSTPTLSRGLSKIHTRRMLILTKQIRTLTQTLAQTPEKTYSYKEWVRLLRVIHIQIGINSAQFWLSPFTPLRVPIVESCFFLLTSLAALDEKIAQIIHLQKGTTRPHKRGERVGYFQNKKRRRRLPVTSM